MNVDKGEKRKKKVRTVKEQLPKTVALSKRATENGSSFYTVLTSFLLYLLTLFSIFMREKTCLELELLLLVALFSGATILVALSKRVTKNS